MKNKRIIAVAMATGMAVSLAACGGSASTTDTTGTADAATTEAADAATGEGTGFSFRNPSGEELKNCILSALSVYRRNGDAWKQLQRQAMEQDFSWKISAKKYLDIYQKLMG